MNNSRDIVILIKSFKSLIEDREIPTDINNKKPKILLVEDNEIN